MRITAFVLACLAAVAAHAQSYPARPVTLVSTAPAGGSIDAVARLIATDLAKAIGQPLVVETKPGAGGNIAAEFVSKAAPDGYTIMISSSSTLTTNPHIYKSLPFDADKSFTPIIQPTRMNMILAVHPKLNVTSVEQFVAALKSQPGKLNFASGGVGTLQHVAAELFAMQTGTKASHVPYKGVAPAMTDLVAGQTDYMFDSATSVPHVKAGKLRALAVVGPDRLPALPEVATFKELGVAGMEAAAGYYAIVAPAGTPREIVDRLNAEMTKILKQPAVVERISAIGLEPHTSTPEQLGAALRNDRARLAQVIKAAGVSAQ